MTIEETPAHTDHPLRHWDRTCPACVAEGYDAARERYLWLCGHCDQELFELTAWREFGRVHGFEAGVVAGMWHVLQKDDTDGWKLEEDKP